MKKLIVLCVASVVLGACSNTNQTQENRPTIDQPVESTHDMSMDHGEMITNEKDFITQMIPHHQEAIDTSMLVFDSSTNEELKNFAQEVITVQTAEVNEMKQWMKQWYDEEYLDNTSYVPMMKDLNNLDEDALDTSYIEGMIDHHNGAIKMAEEVLLLNPREEVKVMAENIIAVQQTEVDMLQSWLNK